MTPAHRGKWLARGLALGLALLLTIAPFAHRTSTFDLVTVAAATSVATLDAAAAGQTAPTLRPAPPPNLGILLRLSLLEKTPGLPLLKPQPIWPSTADEPQAAIRASAAFDGDIGRVLHRSSIGTARTPTGPPS